ncbi:MAG: type II toxin-antitoxin system VapC family toxin [Neisseriaceae bacterium]|nr:type II toxin-antitoxin system VapC family toxin [Neisseriaceae bacterium]MBR5675101.1 type II toxin-antitoxin system VapC family toxin [Neisseriaceae bacterium]MBR5940842.1 type II toxin-antitoxin system VapC family toxin [Neisseriaceae bacterium]
MIYLLDTNTCIYLLKNNPPEVAERFSELHQDEAAISAITWAELCCGLNTHTAEPILNALKDSVSVLPFDDKAAQIYGELTQKFPNRKGNFDRLIAAHAIALDAILVSNNVADFKMYDLTVENWVKEDN